MLTFNILREEVIKFTVTPKNTGQTASTPHSEVNKNAVRGLHIFGAIHISIHSLIGGSTSWIKYGATSKSQQLEDQCGNYSSHCVPKVSVNGVCMCVCVFYVGFVPG